MTVNPGQGTNQLPGMNTVPTQQQGVPNNAWTAGATTSNSTVTTTPMFPAGMNVQAIIADFYNKNPNDIKILSQALKNANYNVKVTSKPNPDLLQTYLKAQADFMVLKNAAPTTPVNDIYGYLAFVDQTGMGGAGTTATARQKSVRLIDDTTATALVNAVFEDQLGRKASAKEIAKYTANLRKAQAAAPTVTTTTTTAKEGMTSSSSQTTGGLNEQQFLIQQIGGTDEAKAKQVFDFYSAFKNLLGVQ